MERPSENRILEDRRLTFDDVHFAEVRSCEIADEYTKLKVQISAILLAFIGLFTPQVLTGITEFKGDFLLTLKWLYAIAVVSIVLSLVMGLIHLKRKENFWLTLLRTRVKRLKKWKEVLDGGSYNEAMAYFEGIRLGDGDVVYSPMWTWIIQTVFLAIGVSILLILFFIVLFV